MRYFLAFLIIAVLFFPPYSHAQDKAGICDRYARSALEFQKQNLLNRCGYSGPEWSDNFRYHFDWCMNGQNFRSAEKWTQWREVRIANCRSTSNLGNLQHQEVQDTTTACRNYASDAVRQQQENIRLSCGLVGPEWNLEFQYHYAWCMNGNNLQSAQNGLKK